jgi:SLOG family YspA-like protein
MLGREGETLRRGEMRIAVTGSRYSKSLYYRNMVFRVLDGVLRGAGPDIELVVGDATGIDGHAREWARERGIPLAGGGPFVADWKKYGDNAGPIRNLRMAEAKPDVCYAFPGGTGTASCIHKMIVAGVRVVRVVA